MQCLRQIIFASPKSPLGGRIHRGIQQMAEHASIPLMTLARSKQVQVLDGRLLVMATFRTIHITLLFSGNHRKSLQFLSSLLCSPRQSRWQLTCPRFTTVLPSCYRRRQLSHYRSAENNKSRDTRPISEPPRKMHTKTDELAGCPFIATKCCCHCARAKGPQTLLPHDQPHDRWGCVATPIILYIEPLTYFGLRVCRGLYYVASFMLSVVHRECYMFCQRSRFPCFLSYDPACLFYYPNKRKRIQGQICHWTTIC